MELNDFEENILNNFISNIVLFNGKQDKSETEIQRLRSIIKSDSVKLENKYGANMILNQVQLEIDNFNYKFIFGLDLHTQLVIQGLGDYIKHFKNITIDISGKCLKDEYSNVILAERDYVSLEFVELDTTGLFIRANSILTQEVEDKIFTVYIIMSKILFVKVSYLDNKKKKKKGN